MKYKFELIQSIIDKHNLKKYLEIGWRGIDWRGGPTFRQIKCEKKVGVDPSSYTHLGIGEFYTMTSDQFFNGNKEKFDIIFIDGLHLYEQTTKDIVNSWNCLIDNGWIVVHDCLPKDSEMCNRKRTTKDWTGDVWKAIIWFRQTYPNLYCKVVNLDFGCGVIFKDIPVNLPMPMDIPSYLNLDFGWLQSNLNLLNIVEEI